MNGGIRAKLSVAVHSVGRLLRLKQQQLISPCQVVDTERRLMPAVIGDIASAAVRLRSSPSASRPETKKLPITASIRSSMAPSKRSTAKASPSGSAKRAPATLRSTSGAGFEFEDLISTWQLVKALSGEQAPGIGGVVTQIQAQVSTLGWRIDDLLLTALAATTLRRLAISAKGNLQVTAAGLPADFVARAWEQWRDPQGPFNRAADGLALVTLGTHPIFDAAWREVKSACSGTDSALAMSRIRTNKSQSGVFDSVQKPGGASDEETIELIRRLHVLPTDLQFAQSENETQAIAQCRRLLASGRDDEAQALWNNLINVAKGVRLRTGTITVLDLLSMLRGKFGLRHHPDFERDWETLSNITADHKARIETNLPSGYVVPRTTEIASLQAAIADSPISVVFGESGSGKSALVKSVLDGTYPSWNQVWFGPEELKTALSAARRSALPLGHELSLVLNATVNPQNVLVIDSAERIEVGEFGVIRQLLRAIIPHEGATTEGAWRVVIVTQTQSLIEGEDTMLGGRYAHLVEVDTLPSDAVKIALLPSPVLGWLAAHDDTIAALTNLRTLAWVIKAGSALVSTAGGLASHTAIADRLWKYWTKDRADVQALMMRFAQREASFERSFALTDLDPAETATFTQRPHELPLRLNERTNRVEFDHDLAADWARFQFLKQIWTDTPQWAALAGSPLWTNALRMLGQFLLRQLVETGSAWDVAFASAEAAKNELAGHILLDALCLDSNAEHFLTERVDLLLGNDAKHLARLLQRFHHIATVPTGGGMGPDAAVSLYMEAQYRSLVFGRWPPVLRFLIAQRERLAGLVSSSLAKVIQTWLMKTPYTVGDRPMPFRLELAEMALAMARTVQIQKGHGVMYLTREPLLYTAPMAGAADLPAEVKHWALELAGRREIDADVKRRVAEVQLQQAKAHSERLKTDAEYRAHHEQRKQIPPALGSFRDRLPPWPLGASNRIDMDFRNACIKENGIQSLMRAQPELAAEVLLALIIDDQPEREYGSRRSELDLGLDYAQDAYPTAFWKSPFFTFLQLAPETALNALIALVNFCTERWVAQAVIDRTGEIPGVPLQFADGSAKIFPGGWQVFHWPQSNHTGNGNLFCALDALERWLTLKLDASDDITAHIERILREGNSAAFVSVLLNVAKYRPSLLKGPLASLTTCPRLFRWDSARVELVRYNFDAGSWLRDGQAVFDFARDWTLAPHRQQRFLDLLVELLLADDDFARRLQALLPTWTLPEDPKAALETKLDFARLDRANYPTDIDQATGTNDHGFVCPDELRDEVLSWQTAAAPALSYILVPDRCEQRLLGGQPLTGDEAAYLISLIQQCEAEAEGDDPGAKSRCRSAAAGTLVALGGAWLAQNAEAQKHALEIVRAGVAAVPSTGEEIRGRRMGSLTDELKFSAYAVMHLWLANGPGVQEWETAVLSLLTSGDARAIEVVVGAAHANREQLGPAWWRLLRAGLFWSGLVLLTPHHGDSGAAKRTWTAWLARLRRFPLRGPNATSDDLDFKRVAEGQERLDFRRRTRIYDAGDQTWRRKPERDRDGILDTQFLGALFHWLIEGEGTGDREVDTRLVLRIWDYDVTRAKTRAKKEYGEYDLPSQNLGYNVLQKLGTLSIAAPAGDDPAVWKPVLVHGPAAHYALQHFISGFFLCLGKGEDPVAFERVWRATAEHGLAADWSQPGLWFHGLRLIGNLLGFGNENALSRLSPGASLRMKDVYERWAGVHLARDEECLRRFCHFLTTTFGAPLRLDGLSWIAAMLKNCNPSRHWYRDGTSEALIELVAVALKSDAATLSQDAQPRQALVEIAAALAAMNIPAALALQERIKHLR